MRALEHLRILDLTHMLSGPYATQLLADMGAEVIKIEPPKLGEGTRRLLERDELHSIDGMGAYFLTLGRNKKSVCIDLKDDRGRAVFYDLVKKVDVVIYNFRVGVASKLGIDYNTLSEYNPKIISCSISGFGETGPRKDAVSFDLVAQASGGGMSITGKDKEPMRSGIPTGDLGGGLMAVIGILSALQARDQIGRGQHVDISMQDAQVSMLNYMMTMFNLSGKEPPAIGNSHFVHVPYDSFETQDGHIILAIITDKLWKKFVSLVDLDQLDTSENEVQPGRWKNRELIMKTVQELLSKNTKDHWTNLFQKSGIPCADVKRFSDLLTDEQLKARNMLVEVSHPNGTKVRQVGHPIKFSFTNEERFESPPLLGRDTTATLKDLLNMSDDDLSMLAKEGIIE